MGNILYHHSYSRLLFHELLKPEKHQMLPYFYEKIKNEGLLILPDKQIPEQEIGQYVFEVYSI